MERKDPSQSIDSLEDLANASSGELYENAPCGFLFTRPDGTFVRLNHSLLQWLGYSQEELVRIKRFQDLLTVGCKIYYETNYGPLLRIQGFLNEVTMDLVTKNGEQLPVLFNSTEVKNQSGTPVLIRSTLFNISDRRKYERELLRERRRAETSERRFRFLSHSGEILRKSTDYKSNMRDLAAHAVLDFCDTCTVDFVTDNNLERLGAAHRFAERPVPLFTSAEEIKPLLSSPLLIEDVVVIEASDKITPWLKTLIKQCDPQSLIVAPIALGNETLGIIGFYLTELGQRFTPEDRDVAVEIGQRAATAIQNARLHEANERAANELRESHEWLSTTLRGIGDAVIAFNRDRTVAFLNGVAESLTGWTSDEAKGRSMDEVFKIIQAETGAPAFNPVDKVFKDGMIVGIANGTALVRKDGSRIMIEDSAAPIKNKDDSITGVVLVFRDVTEKYAEEVSKERTLAQLQQERETREKFVATLTHDLRTPLSAIRMGTQLIGMQVNQPDLVSDLARRLARNVDRADRMIQDMLDVSRIRAGEALPSSRTQGDLAETVKEAIQDLIVAHGDRFVLDVVDPAMGEWDHPSLRRVVENLCNNAVKYGTAETPITVSLKVESHGAELRVTNQGNPISENDQATLFDAYKRASTAHHGGQLGWGLGLTLVRAVAEANGGTVSVTSSAAQGTQFIVSLPII